MRYDVRAIDCRDRLLVGSIILDGPEELAAYVEERLAAGDTFLSILDDDERHVAGIVRGVPRVTPRVSVPPTGGDRRSGMGRRA